MLRGCKRGCKRGCYLTVGRVRTEEQLRRYVVLKQHQSEEQAIPARHGPHV